MPAVIEFPASATNRCCSVLSFGLQYRAPYCRPGMPEESEPPGRGAGAV